MSSAYCSNVTTVALVTPCLMDGQEKVPFDEELQTYLVILKEIFSILIFFYSI